MFEHCKFRLDLDILVQTKDPSTSKDDFVCLTAHAWRIPRIPEAGSWKDDPLSRKCDSHVSCASGRTLGSRDRAPWLYDRLHGIGRIGIVDLQECQAGFVAMKWAVYIYI